MASNKPVDKLADGLKGLVIGASGNIPGHLHDQIKDMVEKCGAKFERLKVSECTHLVTTEDSVRKKLKKIDRASEEGCEIVNVEWLIKSIQNKTPESVQKYLLKPKKEKPAIALKGKKRGRESGPEDEPDTASKKAKDEEKINYKRLVELVDEDFDIPRNGLSVWMDASGVTWDSTMIKLHDRKVRALRMQLLLRRETGQFQVCDFWYEPHSPDTKMLNLGEPGDFASAKQQFLSRFKSFTGLSWDGRYSERVKGHWIFLELSHREAPIISSQVVDLPKEVEKVLKLIFESSPLATYAGALKQMGRDVSFENKRKSREFQIGLAVLKKEIKLGASGSSGKAKTLTSIYQRLSLSPLTQSGGVAQKERPYEARKELESLDLLLKMHDANEILKSSGLSSMGLSQISQVLGLAKMEPVDQTSTEFAGLHEYLFQSSSSSHPNQFSRVIGVFRLERPGEAERFAKWEKDNEVHTGDRRLLWHGSWCGNFAGILSQGLRGDGIINPNGSGFCNGIFFADISTKSAGYCRASPGLEVLMLLCEVELGNETTNTPLAWRYIGRTVHSKWRDAEYIHPDFKGVLVPDVNAETTLGEYKSNFYNSEYVALNPSQVIQRYLFHIKLK